MFGDVRLYWDYPVLSCVLEHLAKYREKEHYDIVNPWVTYNNWRTVTVSKRHLKMGTVSALCLPPNAFTAFDVSWPAARNDRPKRRPQLKLGNIEDV